MSTSSTSNSEALEFDAAALRADVARPESDSRCESQHRARTPSMWRSAWLTLVCVGAIEYLCSLAPFADLHRVRFYTGDGKPNIGDSLVHWKYVHLLKPEVLPRHYPVVLVGDSSCTMGLIPSIIREQTGFNAMNLASNGAATLDVENEMLRLHIAKHGAPRLVVLQLSKHLLCNCNFSMHREYRDQILGWSAGVQESFAFSWKTLFQTLPSVRRRRVLANSVHEYFYPKPDNPNWSQPRDRWPSDQEVDTLLTATNGYLEYPYNEQPGGLDGGTVCTRDWDRMLEDLFRMGQEHHFEVLMVMNPVAGDGMHDKLREAHAKFADKYAELAKPFLNVKVLREGFLREYPAMMTGDGTHLARSGAERNSREVSEYVKQHLNPDGASDSGAIRIAHRSGR